MPLRVWWLVAVVVVAPLATFPSDTGISIAQAKNAVFILLGLAVVVWRMPNPWLQGFAAWTVLVVSVSGWPRWGMEGLLGLLAWLLFYSEAARLKASSWSRVRWAIAGAAIFQVAWMGLQALGADPVFRPVTYGGELAAGGAPAIGWFSNPMDTALFLALSLPALAALSPWLLLITGLALLSLGSTAGLVGLGVTALWWAPGWRWRAGLAVALLVIATWFLMVRDPQGLGRRPMIWRHTVSLIALRPVVGWGPNALGHRIHLWRSLPGRVVGQERWNHVFSEWLQGALELGLIGPALAAGYVLSLGWRLRRRWADAQEALPGALVLLIVSLFSIPLRIGPVALLGALYLGRLEMIAREGEPCKA